MSVGVDEGWLLKLSASAFESSSSSVFSGTFAGCMNLFVVCIVVVVLLLLIMMSSLGYLFVLLCLMLMGFGV